VMQAIGLSPTALARPALIVAVIATGLAYGLSLYLLPTSYRSFKDFQLRIRNDYAQVLLPEGVFTTVSDGLTIYARERDGGALHGLIVYDTRENGRPIIYTAVEGIVSVAATGPTLTMQEGTYQETDPAAGRISILYFDRMAISVADPGALPGQRTLTAWERYLPELLNPVDLAPDDPLRRILTVEAHQRLVYPLYTLAFAVLGLALITPAAADRSRQRAALAAASLSVIGLQGINLTLRNLANAQPELAPLMWIGPLAPLAIAALMMLVERRRAPRLPAREPTLANLATR